MESAVTTRWDEAGSDVEAWPGALSPIAGDNSLAHEAVVAPTESLSRAIKLTLEIIVAAMLLLVMAPLFLVVALLVQLESPGTPFYRARRVGYHGEPLDVVKSARCALMHPACR